MRSKFIMIGYFIETVIGWVFGSVNRLHKIDRFSFTVRFREVPEEGIVIKLFNLDAIHCYFYFCNGKINEMKA